MNRAVMTAAAMLIGAACAPSRLPAANAEAVKQGHRRVLRHVLPKPGPREVPFAPDGRSDVFDFRSVQVHDDTAYAVYFLRVALLHSTRIVKPAD